MKRPYHAPRLTDHGDLGKITQQAGTTIYDAMNGSSSAGPVPIGVCYTYVGSMAIGHRCDVG